MVLHSLPERSQCQRRFENVVDFSHFPLLCIQGLAQRDQQLLTASEEQRALLSEVDSYKADIARLEHKLNAALAEASEFSTKLFEVSAKLGETEEDLATIKEDKEGLETSLSAIQQEKADVQVRGSDGLAFSLGLEG